MPGSESSSDDGEDPFQHTKSGLLEMKRIGLAHVVLGLILVARPVVAQGHLAEKVYGVGIVGNCCTHGAGLCTLFQGRKDTRVVAAFEANPRRAKELAATWGQALSRSYDAVIRDPAVDIVVISCDPSDKAGMVEKAAAAGKAIFLNKPACDSLDAARRIATAVRRHNIRLVHDIPMIRSEPAFARLQDEVRADLRKTPGLSSPLWNELRSLLRLERSLAGASRPPFEIRRRGADQHGLLRDRLRREPARPSQVRPGENAKEWDVYRRADVENFGQIVLDYGDFFAVLEAGKQQLPGPSRHANALTITFEHRAIHIDATARQVSLNHVPHDWDAFTRGATAVGSADRLIQALRDGVSPGDDVTAIVDATEVLMAAYESSLQDGRPIPLPLPRGDNPLTQRR